MADKSGSIYQEYRDKLLDISSRNQSIQTTPKRCVNIDIADKLLKKPSKISKFISWLTTRTSDSFEITIEEYLQSCTDSLEKEDLSSSEVEQLTINLIQPFRDHAANIKRIVKEQKELEKSTGINSLYIGYPYLEGSLDSKTSYLAPLFLFPVEVRVIAKDAIILRHITSYRVSINRDILLAFSKYKKVNIGYTESDSDVSIKYTVDLLTRNGLKVDCKKSAHSTFKTISNDSETVTIKNSSILGLFKSINSIYDDYTKMERNKTTTAIDLLLGKSSTSLLKEFHVETERAEVQILPDNKIYSISSLDYSQELILSELETEENMVISGPPGTGKSQLITNIISQNIYKGKKILMVAEKRQALQVVYDRLGDALQRYAVIIEDWKTGSSLFGLELKTAAEYSYNVDTDASLQERFNRVCQKIEAEAFNLAQLSTTLYKQTDSNEYFKDIFQKAYCNKQALRCVELIADISDISIKSGISKVKDTIKSLQDRNITLDMQELSILNCHKYIVELASINKIEFIEVVAYSNRLLESGSQSDLDELYLRLPDNLYNALEIQYKTGNKDILKSLANDRIYDLLYTDNSLSKIEKRLVHLLLKYTNVNIENVLANIEAHLIESDTKNIDILNRLNSYTKTVLKIHDLRNEKQEICRELLVNTLSKNCVKALNHNDSDLFKINTYTSSNKSIREIYDEMQNTILSIKPIWFLTPETVSNVLPMTKDCLIQSYLTKLLKYL